MELFRWIPHDQRSRSQVNIGTCLEISSVNPTFGISILAISWKVSPTNSFEISQIFVSIFIDMVIPRGILSENFCSTSFGNLSKYFFSNSFWNFPNEFRQLLSKVFRRFIENFSVIALEIPYKIILLKNLSEISSANNLYILSVFLLAKSYKSFLKVTPFGFFWDFFSAIFKKTLISLKIFFYKNLTILLKFPSRVTK